jgi:hypothetical protein
MGRAVVMGILWALLGVFPVAALVALCFRFPIPFAGYESGPSAMLRSLLAVLFYGVVVGGFPVIAALGAASGAVAHRLAGPDVRKRRWLTVGLTLGADFVAVMALAVLDKIIGPW